MADTQNQEYWGRNAYGGYGDARDPNKPSGMQAETTRYANMGADAANRQAYQANYQGYTDSMGAANDSRGQQNNALGLIAQRATGATPSAAEIAGRNAQDQALASTVAAAGTARGGPMQQAAVMRGSLGGLATQNQAITNQIQAGRANEIANAQDAYMQGAGAIRSGDFQGAGLGLQKTGQDIQNEQNQRQLNQQAQETYEQQRQKVFEDQLAANQAAQQESDAAAAQNRGNTLRTEEDAWGKVKDVGSAVLGGVTGAIGGIFGSDERMKLGISPIGSLSGMSQTGMSGDSSPTGSMAVKGGGMDVMGSLAKTNAIDTQYLKSPAGGMMRSDEKTKRGVTRMTDEQAQKEIAATQKQAGDEVAKTRKAGGYAELDMTPIPASYGDKGYQGRDDQAATAKLHGAIERETDGADPYAPQPRDVAADNREEAARIRAQFPAEAGQPGSIGEAAQAQYDKEHGIEKKPSAFSRAMMGMSQSFLGGSLGGVRPAYEPTKWIEQGAGGAGIHPGRDVTYSDARAKEAAYEEGVKAGSVQTHRMYTDPDYARSLGVEPYPGTLAMQQQAKPAEIHGTREMVTTTAGPSASRKETKEERAARGAEPTSKLAALKDRAKALAGKASGATTAALDKMENTTTDTLGALYPDVDPMASAATTPTTPSDKRAKEVLHAEEPMREANRAMAPSEYRYKPEFTPPGQKPGEVNVGPIAQNMKADPVASTAVVTMPDGLLAIDKEKGLKLAMGSLASLQRQIDALARRKEA